MSREKDLANRHYCALLLPYKPDMTIDEEGLRSLVRYFVTNDEFMKRGGFMVNAEAGEVFYLSKQEKRRVLEIVMEEVSGKAPIFAGTFAMSTRELVEETKDVKSMGVDGIFIMPPQGALEVTRALDPVRYPDVWLDQVKEQDRAVDLPMITHPSASVTVPFGAGLPTPVAVKMCKEVPNIIGWKILYNYDGYRRIARALRQLDRHVAILPATAVYFHEMLANDVIDGSVSGSWNYALEHSLAHMGAWEKKNIDEARKIWSSGLAELHEYLYGLGDTGRLHIRYKIAAWLRGLIASPYMRSPYPRPMQEEIDRLYDLLSGLGIKVIDRTQTKKAA